MKKTIMTIVMLLALCGPVRADVTGSVTYVNMRLSLVNGTAFVDFSAASVLSTRLNWYATICDSASKCIRGYIKAAGTGETYGPELCADPGFDNTGAWTKGHANWTVSGGKANAAAVPTGYALYANYTTTAGVLYRLQTACDSLTAGTFNLQRLGGATNLIFNSTGTKDDYYLGVDGALHSYGIRAASVLTATFTDYSLKQVTGPATTGVTITSTRGGTTYNWASIDAGFNYNDSSGYTYTLVAPAWGFYPFSTNFDF